MAFLAPGGGHGTASSINLSDVEVYAKAVPRWAERENPLFCEEALGEAALAADRSSSRVSRIRGSSAVALQNRECDGGPPPFSLPTAQR